MLSVMAFNVSLAAEFVVQTKDDTGGGVTITEISPDVYTIDTLRSAIEQANDEVNFPGHDTIRFDENIPGVITTTITLSQVGDQFNFLSQSSDSAFGIDSVITIQGKLPGESGNNIALAADGLRHFQVNNGGKLRLKYLYLRYGETPKNSAGRGGAVVVDSNGMLEIDACTLNLNEAVNGGALAFQQGALDSLIKNSTLMFNDASDNNPGTDFLGMGGAIYADLGNHKLTIENTEIKNNFADASGGAMHIERTFEILNSRLRANEATLDGGALYSGEQAPFTVSNTIFYDNESGLRGGAIYAGNTAINSGYIVNSTINGNRAGDYILPNKSLRGTGNQAGGGIYSPINDGLWIDNSIVADNFDENLNDPDDVNAKIKMFSSCNLFGVDGNLSTGIGFNIFGNITGTLAQPIEPGIILSSSKVVGLESNSPAVNSGNNLTANDGGLIFDVDGNDRIIGQAVDRGAIESDVLFYNEFE